MKGLLLALPFLFVPVAFSLEDHEKDKEGVGGVAKGGSRLLIYDCGTMSPDSLAPLKQQFTVEVVSLVNPKLLDREGKLDPVAAIEKDLAAREDPPRMTLLACHGSTKSGKLRFSPESQKDTRLTFDVPADKIVAALEKGTNKVKNPLFIALTCHSGAIESCLRPDGFVKEGSVCAACGKDDEVNPVMFAFQFTRAMSKCADIDKNGDGKVSGRELQAWFGRKNALDADVEAFVKEHKTPNEDKIATDLAKERKAALARQKELKKEVAALKGTYPKSIATALESFTKKSAKTGILTWSELVEEALTTGLDWVDKSGAVTDTKLESAVNRYTRLRKPYTEYVKIMRNDDSEEDPRPHWKKFVDDASADLKKLKKDLEALPRNHKKRAEGIQAAEAALALFETIEVERTLKANEQLRQTAALAKPLAALMRMRTPLVLGRKDADNIAFYCPAAAKPGEGPGAKGEGKPGK